METIAEVREASPTSASPWPGIVSLGVGLAAFVSYAATAARTITWWEGSSYPLAACTLGITPPPGSLLLTLYGWLMSHVPVAHSVAFRLSLSAALLGAVTAALVARLSIQVAAFGGRRQGVAEAAAGAFVGLAFAFSPAVWTNATQFKPYILTAGFTALLLAGALAWWRRASQTDARWWLFLIFLLMGLDFSVHRTNALLLPGVLLWITLRRRRVWTRPGVWGAIGAGLALGLSFQLLLIPLSRRDPSFDVCQPRDLASLWSYVSLRQMGGGFLLRIFPRTADPLRVQFADYVRFFQQNVLPPSGGLPVMLLAVASVLLGWAMAVRGRARLFVGLLGLFLCSSAGAVVYFNLPEHYFRSMDRHYLPSLVLFAPLAAIGISGLFRAAVRAPGVGRRLVPVGLSLLFLFPPLESWICNHHRCDLSRVRFAETYARDLIEPLPPHAILLTSGDNDTFPLWYLQQIEGVRGDVAVVNTPLANLGSYIARVRRRDLQGIALPPVLQAPTPRSLRDTTVTIAVGAALRAGPPPLTVAPDSLRIRLSGLLLPQDFFVLDLLRFASGTRPLYVACTVSPDQLAWLRPYLRLDGLALRVVPSEDPAVWDLDRLRRRLLEQVRYAGVADTTVAMDATSQAMCGNYLAALAVLARAQLEAGDAKGCLETLRFAGAKTPPRRLGNSAAPLAALCAQVEAAAKVTAPGGGTAARDSIPGKVR